MMPVERPEATSDEELQSVYDSTAPYQEPPTRADIKKERKAERENVRRQKNLIHLNAKKNGDSKADVALKIAGVHLESAKKLAVASKQQIESDLGEFNRLIITSANDLRELVRELPNEGSDNLRSELTRLTGMIGNAQVAERSIHQKLQTVDIDDPLVGQAMLMDLAMELSQAHMNLATDLLPSLADLFQMAEKENQKSNEGKPQ